MPTSARDDRRRSSAARARGDRGRDRGRRGAERAADRAAGRDRRDGRRRPHRPAAAPTVILMVGRQRHRQDDDDRQARLAPAAASSGCACCWPPPTRSGPPRSSSSRAGRSARARVRHAAPPAPTPARSPSRRRQGATGADVVIVDTAGRLHTQDDLMGELAKVRRVIAKQLPGAPHETLLTRRRDDRPERPAPGAAVRRRGDRGQTGWC
jgi:hypothetical protein